MPKKSSSEPVRVAVIGGSGLYDIPGIKDVKEVRVKTPFGAPSDAIVVGTLSGVRCAFLPRHGRGHRFLPTELPARANIWALKSLGVERVLAVGACGSLQEEFAPRHFVVPDQVFDRTKSRVATFFGEGIVAHVSVDKPFCPAVAGVIHDGAVAAGVTVHRGGVYVCIEGPSFSTRAESLVNKAHGFAVVGMTVVPEYKLAREAELCYATVSLVTDYDVWKEGEEVTIEKVVETLHANVDSVKKLVALALPKLAALGPCSCRSALQHALFTDPKAMPAKTKKKLGLLIGKYVK